MTADDSKFCLNYLNKLVYQYNNTHYHSIGKPISTDYSALIEKLKPILKLLSLKLKIRVRITKYQNICSEGYTENWLLLIVFKTNTWIYEIKYLNGERIIGSIYEKELLLSKL